MAFYSKLIAAIIGLVVVIAAGFGLDLSAYQELLIQAGVGIATAVSVWLVRNTPVTVEQRDKVRDTIHEGVEKEKDKAASE